MRRFLPTPCFLLRHVRTADWLTPSGSIAMDTTELRIDIPVKLKEVKNVFSIASLSFEGTFPRRCSTSNCSWTI